MCFLVAQVLRNPRLRRDLEASPGKIAELEQFYFRQLRRGALAGLSWPATLGTPPWALARALSDDAVRYISIPMDDTSENAVHILHLARKATRAGYPVPFYTGGSLDEDGTWLRKLSVSVPRHVVLAIPGSVRDSSTDSLRDSSTGIRWDSSTDTRWDSPNEEIMTIFDPASGRLFDVEFAELLHRATPFPAFGGWTHVVWAILPTPR